MSATPVGDWLRRRYPPNDGATHYLGDGDDPGCCAGAHPACLYAAAQREALLSLADELDTEAGECGGDAGQATGIRRAAFMARQRAEAGS